MKCSFLFIALWIFVPFYLNAQNIITVAGNGTPGFSGDGNNALSAEFDGPNTIAFDAGGNLYIVDAKNYRVRKVNTGGIVSEVAGNGTAAFMGDGYAATNAELDYPTSIAIDPQGDIYIGTSLDGRIRKVNTSGIITTIAGNNSATYNGDNIPATSAELDYPYLGKFDNSGNLYFSDYNNYRVRKIDISGIITTIAGNGTNGTTGDGYPATACEFGGPAPIAISLSGDFYIPDNIFVRVRKINALHIITTIAGTGAYGNTGDGGQATNATFSSPNSVAVDNAGNIYVADYGANVIRKIDASGIISTIAGTGVAGYNGDNIPATAAELNGPNDIAFNAAGNLFIAELNNNRVREIIYNTTGVKNIPNLQNNIGIYPNPANNEVTIKAPDKIENIEVLNLIGQVVYKQSYININSAEVTISNFANGVYFLKVNGVYGGKFIKE